MQKAGPTGAEEITNESTSISLGLDLERQDGLVSMTPWLFKSSSSLATSLTVQSWTAPDQINRTSVDYGLHAIKALDCSRTMGRCRVMGL